MSIALQINGTSVLSGQVNFVASTTAESSINIPQGIAPTAPNNGDLWTTSSGVYAFINGATVGPFGFSGYTFNAPLVNTSGTITVSPATNSTLGVVKTDGVTLSNSGGSIAVVGSALTSLPANTALYPTLNQNTTGTAANLSGTPALPNGTTAATQAPGTNNTTLATTAFVAAATSTPALSYLTNALTANVALNNTSAYFDGPSVAQGSSGTWFVVGTVTLEDTTGFVFNSNVKLWDGTTVIASTFAAANNSGGINVTLSGIITSPAGNLRISVNDIVSTTGYIAFNKSGNSKDTTITAIRIQ